MGKKRRRRRRREKKTAKKKREREKRNQNAFHPKKNIVPIKHSIPFRFVSFRFRSSPISTTTAAKEREGKEGRDHLFFVWWLVAYL